MYLSYTLLMHYSKDNQRVLQDFLIFFVTIFFALSVKLRSCSVWTFMNTVMRFGECSENFQVSFRMPSTSLMYLTLSPVSAQGRVNLWQMQWKFNITLLTLLNRAPTPLCFPLITLAPSLTNYLRFLTSESHSFKTSRISAVITSRFAPLGLLRHSVARNSVLI